jgi:hypothetical protein
MKTKNYTFGLLLVFAFSACKKEKGEVTKPVEFTETTYQTQGTIDASGAPSTLLPKDAVSSNMLSYIRTTLPEGADLRKTNPDLLKNTAIADITITQPSDIFITFLAQGTGFRNTVAFYTYPTSTPPASAKDIKTITYIFPNAGNQTPLQPGDKVKIGRFEVGTSVGFVLLKDAWNPTTKAINNTAVHFCSNDVLNPEVDPNLKKHAVLFNYASENKVLIGFEDIDRTESECDHDFNDVVVYATVTP